MILRTIRHRMLATAVVPVALVIFVVVGIFWAGRSGDFDQAHTERAKLLVRQLAIASEYGVFSGNKSSLQTLVMAMQREPDVLAASVFDKEGRPLASAGSPSSLTFAMSQELKHIAQQRQRGVDLLSEPIVAVSVALDDLFEDAAQVPGAQRASKAPLGYAAIELSRESLIRREKDLLYISLAVGLVGLLLGALLAVKMGEGVVQPILRVARTIERIGRGDFSSKNPWAGPDPLAELQLALQKMALRLSQGRDELQQRVDVATLELREKKEEAEAATLAKSRFLASASHDLRQPTHALGMFIARLGQLPLDLQASELVGNLEAAVQAMQDLLDGLLDLSRLEAGAVQVHRTTVPMGPLLTTIEVALQSVAHSKNLRLRVRPSGLWGLTDPVLLQRIVLNLANNALRYTEQGTVLIACRQEQGGKFVRIEVWDSGIGISPEHQTEVFKEFYQVGNSGRDRAFGLGLGLNIVKRSAELLGHRVEVRSALGCGTRFSIVLPLATAPAVVPSLDAVEAPVSIGAEGQSIFVIEDDAFAREAILSLLTSWGYTVFASPNITLALAQARSQGAPDVLVSDYRLSQGENGLDAIAQLRALAGVDIPACLMSGDTDGDLMQAAREAKLTLLHKPVRPAKLRSLLRRLTALAPSDTKLVD